MVTMTLGRSLTRKSSKHSFSSSRSESPARKDSTKRLSATVAKTQISAPVALISTTNMISYTSPSLRQSVSHGSISSVSSSGSPTSAKFPNSPISSGEETEMSSPDEPYSPPMRNHLSLYFTTSSVAPPPSRSCSTKSTSSTRSARSFRAETPVTPVAPPLSRSATRRMSGGKNALHSSNSFRGRNPSRASNGNVGLPNPFGAELAKVAEIAEDMGVDVMDEDEEYMISHGLQKFTARDYLHEIGIEFGGVFEDKILDLGTGWI